MLETTEVNPLREGLTSRTMPHPCAVVIFGATGDLTHRKLVPALYNLAADGALPPTVSVVGFARRDKTDEVFRKELEEAARKFSRQKISDDLWAGFASSIFYHRSEFDALEGYESLAKRLDELDAQRGTRGNRLYYLSAGPDQFPIILENLRKSGLNKERQGSWARAIVEKPFGTDLPGAQRLNAIVQEAFSEKDTFRIDHYLGKETAQNIMVHALCECDLRTALERPLHRPRADYRERAARCGGPCGLLRQVRRDCATWCKTICCSSFASPQWSRPPDSMRCRSRRKGKGPQVPSTDSRATMSHQHVVRAQYGAGTVNGKRVPAYRDEQNIDPDSMTETYVALHINVDNWRWAGRAVLCASRQAPAKSEHRDRNPIQGALPRCSSTSMDKRLIRTLS